MLVDEKRTYICRRELRDLPEDQRAVTLDLLSTAPLWEYDFITDCWHKRTPEFLSARAEAEVDVKEKQPRAVRALALLMEEITQFLPVQKSGPTARALESGLRYSEVTTPTPGWIPEHQNFDDSLAAFKRKLLEYVAVHRGDVLFWRESPEICGRVNQMTGEQMWMVYSRLAIE